MNGKGFFAAVVRRRRRVLALYAAAAVLCALLDVLEGAIKGFHGLLSVRVRGRGVAFGDESSKAVQRDWIPVGKRAHYNPHSFRRGFLGLGREVDFKVMHSIRASIASRGGQHHTCSNNRFTVVS